LGVSAFNRLGQPHFPRLTGSPERDAWLVCLPLIATALYYSLPTDMRAKTWVMFSPQIIGYGTLAIWSLRKHRPWMLLGLNPSTLPTGLRLGSVVGVVLGTLNLILILWVIPALGADTDFLRDTPHAHAALWVMFPMGIAIIGTLVELNFRGFQLGRLAALLGPSALGQITAVIISAMSFAWDPFMVHVFRSLHWIALWDGLVWGFLVLRTRSLYATMVAHTIEVLILYGSLKLWFG
jgi:membrane protease YdiL (CAAX protease family)